MEKCKERIRLIILVLLVVAIFLTGGFRLMQFQVVNGAEYAAQANRLTTSRTEIKAARGEIVDRYGRPLVTNKVGFNIIFYRSFMPKGEENEIISGLIDLLEKSGVEWIDECPITKTTPYQFIKGMDDEVAKMKKLLRLNTYATAQNCMDELIKQAEIEGYDEERTRLIAGVRYQMLRTEFSLYNNYTFAEDVPASLVAAVKELSDQFPGVDVSEETMRSYVSGTIAPHIIGTIGPIYAEEYDELKDKGYKMNDVIGKSGIESAMESYLRGTDGVREISQNKNGQVISDTVTTEAVPGNTVMLTIDKYFQQEVQNILEDHILNVEHNTEDGKDAFAGAVVVLDVKTGEVLACATYPSYDINDYRTKYSELSSDKVGLPLFNRALQGAYRPGSTFKTAVAVGALSEGTINKSTTFRCTRKYERYPGMNCTGYHGTLSVVRAIRDSCNIFFYETGQKLGIENIDKYANALGLGVDTGLEIYAETGAVSSPERAKALGREWQYGGDEAQTSIGQLDTVVTPLQMATQAMTLANNGTRYETHIVKSIQSYNFDKTITETQPVVASQLENKNGAFDIVREGMMAAADKYASFQRLPVDAALKTGTPQTTKTTFHSAAIAYAPAEDAEISIGVYIEKGCRAREVVPRVIEAYLKTKETQKQYPQASQTLLP